jgi:hypothetical protein
LDQLQFKVLPWDQLQLKILELGKVIISTPPLDIREKERYQLPMNQVTHRKVFLLKKESWTLLVHTILIILVRVKLIIVKFQEGTINGILGKHPSCQKKRSLVTTVNLM